MRSLPEDEVEAFEVHYFACPACATILQKAAANVDAIRAAAQKLRSEAPHQTSARSL
jgi:anti-sigma factor RsiW